MKLPIPTLEPLARFEVDLETPLDLGRTPAGHRRVVPIVGGRFEGPRLRGEVLAGGADWQLLRQDGTIDVETRCTLRTDDNALVSIRTTGVRTGPAWVLAAVGCGEDVDPADYYFRVAVAFETGSPTYAWLNDVVAVSSAARFALRVVHDAYVVR